VRPQRELRVARLADAQAVGVAEGRVQGDWGGGVRDVPEGGEERLLGLQEGGVGAGVELGGGPVELVDLGVGGGEACFGG
jgi:hypothetical protein